MSSEWPAVDYPAGGATCDTLHAHTQVLGKLVVTLDLHAHEAIAEHSNGRVARVALTPDRPVGEVTRELLATLQDLAGPVNIDPTPQEVWWTAALDADDEHATYDA